MLPTPCASAIACRHAAPARARARGRKPDLADRREETCPLLPRLEPSRNPSGAFPQARSSTCCRAVRSLSGWRTGSAARRARSAASSTCTSSRLSRATGCRPAGRDGRTATHQPTETHQPASATQPAATTRTRATLPSLACAASPLPPAGGGPRTPRRAARQGPLPSRREIEPRSQPRSSRDGSPASALSGPLPPGAANVGKSAFLQSTPGPRCRTPASARLPRPHSSRCAFGGCQPSEAATPADSNTTFK